MMVLVLNSIPVASSGKLDKKKLPQLDLDHGDEEGQPTTPTERAVSKLWCEVLGLRTVDVQESFFDVGGYVIEQVSWK